MYRELHNKYLHCHVDSDSLRRKMGLITELISRFKMRQIVNGCPTLTQILYSKKCDGDKPSQGFYQLEELKTGIRFCYSSDIPLEF